MDKELIEAEIRACKQLLASTDYIGIKIGEGSATAEKYAPELAQREAWRETIRGLEAQLNADTTGQN